MEVILYPLIIVIVGIPLLVSYFKSRNFVSKSFKVEAVIQGDTEEENSSKEKILRVLTKGSTRSVNVSFYDESGKEVVAKVELDKRYHFGRKNIKLFVSRDNPQEVLPVSVYYRNIAVLLIFFIFFLPIVVKQFPQIAPENSSIERSEKDSLGNQ